jgi:NADH:ubiquinone reductase (H+-translocating)
MATRQARGGTLILGGGFAGATLAQRLGKQGATIVNPDNFMTYTPMLPEAASGIIDGRHVVVPLRAMCPHAELLLGYATGLDEEKQEVTVATDEGEQTIGYENLVIGLGAIIRIFPIPGLAEHTLPFKTLPDAMNLRNHVLRQLEDAVVATDERRRQKHLTFVFIGGGYSGVESCTEMNDLVRDALRHYPDLKGVKQRWVLVDAAPHILSTLPPKLTAYATKHLTDDGIEIRSDTRLDRVEEDAVVLSDGERIEAGTIVWAAGVEPHPLVKHLGLPLDERSGSLDVDEYLRAKGRQNIYALGDCAHVPNPKNERGFDPPTCQHAIRQAKRLAKNLKSGSPTPYAFKTLGQVAQLGRYKGVSETVGVRMRGFMGWFIARGYHLYAFPLMARRIRIMIDWALGLFFKRDIVQLGGPPEKGHEQPETLHEAMAKGTHEIGAMAETLAGQDGAPAPDPQAEPRPA